jgi:TfoX/Sxy family transcriptional regulator of competence genes
MEGRRLTETDPGAPLSTAGEAYARLCASFFSRGEVRPSEKRGFGAAALTVEGHIFAMLPHDRLVVKLPTARVDELVAAGYGARFDANKGRPMKQWLAIDPAHEGDWDKLASEALAFVRSHP